MRIVGVDPSLTGTGVAWTEGRRLRTRLIESPPAGYSLAARHRRLARVHAEIYRETLGADLLLIEGPSFGSVGGARHDRSGLWWLIVSQASVSGIPVVEISPRSRALYATGNGNAGKAQVIEAAQGVGGLSSRNDNEVDAAVLARMGARYLGLPLDQEEPWTERAMRGVAWPERKAGA